MIYYNGVEIESIKSISSERIERLKLLLTTRVGTVVLDRDFGIEMNFIDKPVPVAKRLFMLAFVRKIKKYEPGLIINSITFKADSDDVSKMIPVINVSEG